MKLLSDKMIEDLKISLCLDLMAEKERNELLTNILEVISQQASSVIMKGLSDEKVNEFNMIPKDNLDAMEDFLIKNNPASPEIFSRIAMETKEKLLNSKIKI